MVLNMRYKIIIKQTYGHDYTPKLLYDTELIGLNSFSKLSIKLKWEWELRTSFTLCFVQHDFGQISHKFALKNSNWAGRCVSGVEHFSNICESENIDSLTYM